MGVTTDRDDPGLKNVDPETNMQEVYLVLPEEERQKGYVVPYYDRYLHLVCGSQTKMGQALSETYARNPHFYGATYCVACKGHFPVGVTGQFVWIDKNNNRTDLKVGTTPEEMQVWREAGGTVSGEVGQPGVDTGPETEGDDPSAKRKRRVGASSPAADGDAVQGAVLPVPPEVP